MRPQVFQNVGRWNGEQQGGFKPESEWFLETDGTNLAEVMVYPEVCFQETRSNDVLEMFSVLGIEGARSSLFNELRAVLSFDGAYVNYRHISCLADCMTYGGYIMAISRHGINKSEAGPMLRASFEETVEVFMGAAAFSQHDDLNGVTENVMLGQLGQLGTGLIDLLVDSEKLINAVPFQHDGDLREEDDLMGGEKGGGFGQQFNSEGTPYFGATPSFTPGGGTGNQTSYGFSSTPMQGAFSNQTPLLGDKSPGYAASPFYSATPLHGASPGAGGYQPYSPARSAASPYGAASPAYQPSPAYSPTR